MKKPTKWFIHSFPVTAKQKKILKQKAKRAGFISVSKYIRSIIFKIKDK